MMRGDKMMVMVVVVDNTFFLDSFLLCVKNCSLRNVFSTYSARCWAWELKAWFLVFFGHSCCNRGHIMSLASRGTRYTNPSCEHQAPLHCNCLFIFIVKRDVCMRLANYQKVLPVRQTSKCVTLSVYVRTYVRPKLLLRSRTRTLVASSYYRTSSRLV